MNTTANLSSWPWLQGNNAKAARASTLLPLLLSLALATADAQIYSILHPFNVTDGARPYAGLVLSGYTLYGTTQSGGSSNRGVVFKVNTDGSGYSIIKNFTGTDGEQALGRLVPSETTLYGTTVHGGSPGYGVVFKVNTNGSGYAVLKNFTGPDGSYPFAGLVLSGSTLYGTTHNGGTSDYGVVFKVNTDGSGYAVLKNFTLNDGVYPYADLVLLGSTLYRTTDYGGSLNYGVIFKVNTDGSGYSILKNFTRADGSHPLASLVSVGGTLYGTTAYGGIGGDYGSIFKINADGTGYALLKSFFGGSDGQNPLARLVLAGSTLYGTTDSGGTANAGLVFKVNTDGTGYVVLKNFTVSDGAEPRSDLVLLGSTFYGTTLSGGDFDNGVIFRLSYLSIISAPLTQTAEAGTTVRFSVQATELAPGLAYQWLFNGTALVGETNAFLELTNVQTGQAGAYMAAVTDHGSSVTTSPAILSVIAPVPRRTVPALTLSGQVGSFLNLDSRTTLDSSANWETFDTVPLTNAPQKYFDLTAPPAPQQFYRAWQTNVLSPPSIRDVHLVPAITLTGAIGSSVRVDCINQFGPIDAWLTLDTVTLANTSQLYFDTSSIGHPARLYRLVPVPK